jgi:3-oxoacyl-(acyl-carrier-protein) synthase
MSARGSVEVKKRIVITGVGPVTPIGIGKKAYWEALMRGQSGARVIDFAGYDMEQYSTRIACPVEGFSLENHVEKTKESRYLGRTSQFAIAGARLALEDAGLDLEPMETGSNRGDYTLKGEYGSLRKIPSKAYPKPRAQENLSLCSSPYPDSRRTGKRFKEIRHKGSDDECFDGVRVRDSRGHPGL